jgi:hypothetical protein
MVKRAAQGPNVRTNSVLNASIAITLKCTNHAVYELKDIALNVGIPPIVDGYECDEDTPCLCPYDSNYIQTFTTYQDYKNHLYDTHDSLPLQRRRHTKPCSEPVRQLRRERARNQHNTGVFLNTHVKKETLVEFVRLYDDFIQDMFRNTSFGDDQYQRTWNDNLRIRPRDLDNYSLESMIENRKDACLGRYRKRDRWCDDD